MPISRRRVLVGLLAAPLVACAGDGLSRYEGTLSARYWPGHVPRWRAVVPPSDGSGLPLVLALHGRGGSADDAFAMLGLQDHAARTGLAVASVDGGETYWHDRRGGVDTASMVRDELWGVLQHELGPVSWLGLLGWSMGGYGALLLASEPWPGGRVGAVAAASAALWTSPGASSPGAFDDRADFVAHDVFERVPALRAVPVRLDVGDQDPFVAANRAFARRLPTAALTVDAGGHTPDYWRSHAGAQMDWLAGRAR